MWKKNCQSTYGRSSATDGSTTRAPSNGGSGSSRERDLVAVLARVRERDERLADALGVLHAKPLLVGPRPLTERGAALPGRAART